MAGTTWELRNGALCITVEVNGSLRTMTEEELKTYVESIEGNTDGLRDDLYNIHHLLKRVGNIVELVRKPQTRYLPCPAPPAPNTDP
jgi:paraquat-inducible protein B